MFTLSKKSTKKSTTKTVLSMLAGCLVLGSMHALAWAEASATLDEKSKHAAVLRSMANEDSGGADLSWLNIGGVVEVEASLSNDFEGIDSADVTLATVELAMEAAIHDMANAHIVLLHEDGGGTPINVDEATITIGNAERSPFSLVAGRTAVPFGNFTTHLVSDPLTLEMAETFESIVQVAFESDGFYGSVYGFNGEANEANEDHTAQFGGNLGYLLERASMSLDVGLSFINSMEDSDAITDAFAEDGDEDGSPDMDITRMESHIGGIGAYGILSFGGLTLIGEYVGANKAFAANELSWNGNGAQPIAWNAELAYTFDWRGREIVLATAYQGTDEALALGLPKQRYLAGVSVGVYQNTSLSVEWFHDQDYGTDDTVDGDSSTSGSGNHSNAATVQLAVEF